MQDDKVNIKTPKGGKPTWVVVPACKDEVLGSLTFHDHVILDLFLAKYRELDAHGFGLLTFSIDEGNPGNAS